MVEFEIRDTTIIYHAISRIPRIPDFIHRLLDMEKLSAGEQHELIMLYYLLFRASKNSLILIDEPERSHHVTWQEKWLGDIEQIAGHSGFRAIVATHSPEIIGDRWSMVVELQNQDNS